MAEDQSTPAIDPAAEVYRRAGMVNPTLSADGTHYFANPGGKSIGGGDPPNPFARADDGKAPPQESAPEVSAGSAALTGLASGATLGASADIAGLAAVGRHKEIPHPAWLSLPGDVVEGGLRLGYESLFGKPSSSLVTGDSAAKKFEAARAEQKQAEATAAEQQPWSYYPSEFAGGVAVPVGGALKTTATYGMRAWEAAKAGMTLGGLSGFFGSEDTDLASRAKGTGVGTALGGLLGPVIPTLQKGALEGGRLLAHATHLDQLPEALRAWRNPATLDDVAARHVGEAALKARGGEFKPGDATFADQHGQPVANVDIMGEQGRSLLRTQTNTSPTAQQDADKYFKDNANSFAERTAKFVRSFGPLSAGGKAPMREELDQLARQQNAPAYIKAYNAGDRVIYSKELERLSTAPDVQEAIEHGMREWKNWQVYDKFGAANPPFEIKNGGLVTRTGGQFPTYPNIQLWDYAARYLEGQAQAAGATNKTAATKFGGLARDLKTELDKQVKEYGEARAGAAKHFGASDAYDAGREFVSRTMDMSEAEMGHAKFKPAEAALFQDGFFGKLADDVTKTGRRTQLLDSIARSPDAQARVKLAAANDPAALDKFITYMRIQHISELSARALGNSTTAKQLMASGAIGIGAGIGEGFVQGDGISPTKALTAAIGFGLNAGKQRLNGQLANRITEMLLSNDPKVMERAVAIARNNSAVKDGVRNVELLLERAVGEASGRSAAPLTASDDQ